jgi:O-antigen/teichoic acid export membrane protein
VREALAARAGAALAWQGIQLVGVKAIYLVRIVVLARLLSPEDFGLLAISVIAIDLLLALTNPGMLQALVHRGTRERDGEVDAAWTIGVVRAVVVCAILLAAAPLVGALFAEPRATALVQVLALKPLLEAATSMRVATLVRELRFRGVAAMNVAEALANTVVSVALAAPFGVWALVFGPLAGGAMSAAVSYLVAPYRPRLSFRGSALRPLVGYGRWIFLGGVLGVGTTMVLQVAVSRTLGAAELGLFFLAGKLAYLAWEASNALVEKVAFPMYANLQADPAEAARSFRFFLTAVGALLVPASAVLVLLAPGLVETVLGERWDGTAPLVRVLAVVVMVGMLGDAIVPVLLGFGRPWGAAMIEALQFGVVATVVWGFLAWWGIVGAPLALLAAAGAAQIAGITLLARTLDRPFRGMSRPVLAVAGATAAGLAAAWIVDALLPGAMGVLAAFGAAGVAVLVSLRLLDRRLGTGLAEGLGRLYPAIHAWRTRSLVGEEAS